MQYTFTRDEDILQHHGILGQKWGVRRFQNSDGTLTDAGRKRYSSELKEGLKNSRYDAAPETTVSDKNLSGSLKKIHEDLSANKKELDAAEADCKKLLGDVTNFTSDERCKYSAIAALTYEGSRWNLNMSMHDLASTIWFYTCEDGDQGHINSISCYLKDKGTEKEAINAYSKYEEASKKYKETAAKEVQALISKQGSSDVSDETVQIGKNAARQYFNSDTKDHDASWYIGESGTDLANMTSKENDAYAQAKNLVSKMQLNSNGAGAFNNINRNIMDAVYENELEDVSISDMSANDWKKFNDRLNG